MTAPGAPAPPTLRLPVPVWAVPLVLLIVAVGPLPYGYYGLLRLVVCASAAYSAYALLSGAQRPWLAWTFVGLAILYNPIFRVHFERETWSIINVISAAPYGLLGWWTRPRGAAGGK